MPLTIAGDGPGRAALEARATAHGLDCRFEGFASRARLAALYGDASCVVLASRRGEGLPNVVLEAMASARAVIATACAGTRDLIVDGSNGIIVPTDDPAALAAALARLRDDAALAERLGIAARVTAEAFAWDAVRPGLERALERCAGAR
jgi:glycosyltransferase involved in cell wall biosynthesis